MYDENKSRNTRKGRGGEGRGKEEGREGKKKKRGREKRKENTENFLTVNYKFYTNESYY